MPDQKAFKTKPSPWHISVAAEAIAAAQFARCGYDVSVQYGADQPEYDLVIAKENHLLKVSVKGSQDFGWGLTQSYMAPAAAKSGKKADYHGAIDLWLRRHGGRTVFCFVQFGGVSSLNEMPRMYLVTPKEVAEWLHKAAKGRGDTILEERHTWTSRAYAAGTIDAIPPHWKFSNERIQELIHNTESGLETETAHTASLSGV
jgi:hypothetical protein